MNIAASIAAHERPMAIRWFHWAKKLGGLEGHKLFLIPAAGTDAGGVIAAAEMAFHGAVEVLRDAEDIKSDWQSTDLARSAAGPNSSFRQLAWHFFIEKLGPWLFVEMDCIPLKSGWADMIETEYRMNGRAFMGAQVLIQSVPPHMSGNAVYPEATPQLAPSLIMRTNWTANGKEYELAFDVAGANEVMQNVHWTNLIQHNFRHAGFKSRAEVDALIRPEAVLFHSNKDGSLIEILSGGVESGHANIVESSEKSLDSGSSAPPAQNLSGAENGVQGEPATGLPALDPHETSAPEYSSGLETQAPTFDPDIYNESDSREALVHDTVAVLKQLASAPRFIAQVRRELAVQGVTPKMSMKRR